MGLKDLDCNGGGGNIVWRNGGSGGRYGAGGAEGRVGGGTWRLTGGNLGLGGGISFIKFNIWSKLRPGLGPDGGCWRPFLK